MWGMRRLLPRGHQERVQPLQKRWMESCTLVAARVGENATCCRHRRAEMTSTMWLWRLLWLVHHQRGVAVDGNNNILTCHVCVVRRMRQRVL